MALQFTDTSPFTDRVSHGTGSTLENLARGANGMTVAAWVYRDANGGNQTVAAKDGTGGTGWNFLVDDAPDEGAIRFIVFRSSITDYVSAAAAVPLNTWVYVAVTFDDALATEVGIYTGSLSAIATEVSYNTTTNGSGTPTSDAGVNLYVGNLERAPTNPFNGREDNIRIWNRRLTLEQIQQTQFDYEAQPSGLVLFSIYDGTGQQADLSGNGNNGTVTRATQADSAPLGMPFGFSSFVPYIVSAGSSANLTSSRTDSGDVASAALSSIVKLTSSRTDSGDVAVSSLKSIVNLTSSRSDSGDVAVSSLKSIVNLTSSRSDSGDVASASLISQQLSLLTSSILEEGDIVLSSLDSILKVSSAISEIGDISSAVLDSLIKISSSISDLGDSTSASLSSQTFSLISSSISELGDLVGSNLDVIIKVSANVSELDTTSSSIEVLVEMSHSNSDLGDSISSTIRATTSISPEDNDISISVTFNLSDLALSSSFNLSDINMSVSV